MCEESSWIRVLLLTKQFNITANEGIDFDFFWPEEDYQKPSPSPPLTEDTKLIGMRPWTLSHIKREQYNMK